MSTNPLIIQLYEKVEINEYQISFSRDIWLVIRL